MSRVTGELQTSAEYSPHATSKSEPNTAGLAGNEVSRFIEQSQPPSELVAVQLCATSDEVYEAGKRPPPRLWIYESSTSARRATPFQLGPAWAGSGESDTNEEKLPPTTHTHTTCLLGARLRGTQSSPPLPKAQKRLSASACHSGKVRYDASPSKGA